MYQDKTQAYPPMDYHLLFFQKMFTNTNVMIKLPEQLR